MKLHSRPALKVSKSKRLGRGYGSGKGGHTSTRGQKGQKTRGKIPAHFVGTSWVWFKRLPFIRGKSLFSPIRGYYTLTLSDLNCFKSGDEVSLATLIEHGLVSKNTPRKTMLKLVGSGKLEKELTVLIPASSSAIEAIKKAGGEYRGQAT